MAKIKVSNWYTKQVTAKSGKTFDLVVFEFENGYKTEFFPKDESMSFLLHMMEGN